MNAQVQSILNSITSPQGSGGGYERVPTKTPEQQKLLNQNIKQAQDLQQGGYKDAIGLLQQYLDPNSDVYKNFEKPYLQEFEQQTLPGIANRYAGLNAMGSGLMTSGFGQTLGAAGANLQSQLAQMKQQYQRQSINDLLQQYNQLTNSSLGTNTFENTYVPPTEDPLMSLIKTGVTGAAAAAGGPLAGAATKFFTDKLKNNTQSQPFSAGTPGNGGYQGRFGNLDVNYGGY